MRLEQLIEIVPRADRLWGEALIVEMPKWSIFGHKREAAFIAHTAHETAHFTKFDERLYYTDAERVRQLFRRHFDPLDVDDAWGYLNQPERFASRVYANRMGNGDEASKDGWRYRGRGLPMLTGRDAYRAFGQATKLPAEDKPDLLLTPMVGVMAGCWFWKWKGLAALADTGEFEVMTIRWNGGLNGLKEREELYGRALEVLA